MLPGVQAASQGRGPLALAAEEALEASLAALLRLHLGEDLGADRVEVVLGLVEHGGHGAVVAVEGVEGLVGRRWRDQACRGLQLTSASRRSNLGQSVGQRQGASGARSRLHFRTVSPFG